MYMYIKNPEMKNLGCKLYRIILHLHNQHLVGSKHMNRVTLATPHGTVHPKQSEMVYNIYIYHRFIVRFPMGLASSS